jgi:hypothetical protein
MSLQVSISEAMTAQCSPPPSEPANRAFLRLRLLSVHSAHVGQEVEVHYRWHPYFGSKVLIRQIEERAGPLFAGDDSGRGCRAYSGMDA